MGIFFAQNTVLSPRCINWRSESLFIDAKDIHFRGNYTWGINRLKTWLLTKLQFLTCFLSNIAHPGAHLMITWSRSPMQTAAVCLCMRWQFPVVEWTTSILFWSLFVLFDVRWSDPGRREVPVVETGAFRGRSSGPNIANFVVVVFVVVLFVFMCRDVPRLICNCVRSCCCCCCCCCFSWSCFCCCCVCRCCVCRCCGLLWFVVVCRGCCDCGCGLWVVGVVVVAAAAAGGGVLVLALALLLVFFLFLFLLFLVLLLLLFFFFFSFFFFLFFCVVVLVVFVFVLIVVGVVAFLVVLVASCCRRRRFCCCCCLWCWWWCWYWALRFSTLWFHCDYVVFVTHWG